MKFHTFVSVLTLLIFSNAIQADPWRDKMQSLSKTLIDAFPFLYSSTEFKEKKNEARILKSLESLASQVHGLPVTEGQNWIGADPLIENAQSELQTGFRNAAQLFKNGQYEPAQKLVHASVNRCLACHSAHQVGPQFPATNSEVLAMATPFTMGKAVMFGALRQFDGALDLIENKGYAQINKDNPTGDDLLKLYMVIALRAKLDFKRAEALLDRLKKDSKNPKELSKWSADLQSWKSGSSTASEKDSGSFISNLRDSMALHRLLTDKKSTNEARRGIYQKLATVYTNLGFAPFTFLSEMYAAKAK